MNQGPSRTVGGGGPGGILGALSGAHGGEGDDGGGAQNLIDGNRETILAYFLN